MMEWFRNWFEDFKKDPLNNSGVAIGIILALIGIVLVEYNYITNTREVLLGEVIIRIPLGILNGALIALGLYIIGYLIYMIGKMLFYALVIGIIIWIIQSLWNIVLWTN